jgi:hypothetical protein
MKNKVINKDKDLVLKREPQIFRSKLNNFFKPIPLNTKITDSGENKFFPPSHRE